MERTLGLGALLAVLAVASACGDDHDSPPGTGGGTAAGGTGGAPVAGTGGTRAGASSGGASSAGEAGASAIGGAQATGGGGAGTSSGGAAGRNQAGTSGEAGGSEGGAPQVRCTGTFGDERVLVPAMEDMVLGSPTVSADELDLLFSKGNLYMGGRRIYGAQRATRSAAFGEPTPVAELDSVCAEDEERSLSLSADGLLLYVGCYAGGAAAAPGPLHVARRASRDAPFELDADTYGSVGPNVSVTPDGLTAFSTAEDDLTGQSPPVEYARGRVDQPFGTGHGIPGLETASFVSPFLAPDGLALWGASDVNVVAAARPTLDAPFEEPAVVLAGEKNLLLYGSPELSADCRTVYFVRVDVIDGLPQYRLSAASR